MDVENSNEKEFDRLYGNLKELFRRIHDDTNKYPREICGSWFVQTIETLAENAYFRSRLTNEQLGNIVFMSMRLCRTDYIDALSKNRLRFLVSELNVKRNELSR